MSDNTHHILAYLHQSGYTHNDMKNLFLRERILSPEEVWLSLRNSTVLWEIWGDRSEKILEKSKKVDTQKIDSYLNEKKIDIITYEDPRYPEILKNIGHAPYFFYVRGTLRQDIPLIGIVGSRKSTPYAERILQKIIPDTIAPGVGIVSGGATGVDSIAHHITLESGGYTIAVFGTGIDRCYPAGNKSLFEKIITSGGAVISHFPLGTGPEVYNFPIRNEIVAGITRGILIPEAALSSGTLITAQLALEHGRDVFAVPGDIDRVTSEGSNMLIATGQAKCVRCSGDILEEYFDTESIGSGMTPIVKTPPIFSNEYEKKVYEAIDWGYQTIDTLLSYTELDMTDLLTTIAMLEIWWYIRLTEMWKYHIG
jgi:DNA processing protein